MEFGSENGKTGTRPLSQSLNECAPALEHLLAEPEPEPERAIALALELRCPSANLWGMPRLQSITPALELARALERLPPS